MTGFPGCPEAGTRTAARVSNKQVTCPLTQPSRLPVALLQHIHRIADSTAHHRIADSTKAHYSHRFLPHSAFHVPRSTFLHFYISIFYTPQSVLHISTSHISTFCILHSIFHVPHFTFRILHSAFRILHSTFHISQPTLYTPHSTFHTLHSAIHVPHSTFHVQCPLSKAEVIPSKMLSDRTALILPKYPILPAQRTQMTLFMPDRRNSMMFYSNKSGGVRYAGQNLQN